MGKRSRDSMKRRDANTYEKSNKVQPKVCLPSPRRFKTVTVDPTETVNSRNQLHNGIRKDIKLKQFPTVFISKNCKLLAEAALRKRQQIIGEQSSAVNGTSSTNLCRRETRKHNSLRTTSPTRSSSKKSSSPLTKPITRRSLRRSLPLRKSKENLSNNSDSVAKRVSPSSSPLTNRRRRKALVRALGRIRQKREVRCSKQSKPQPSKHCTQFSNKRVLRKRNPKTPHQKNKNSHLLSQQLSSVRQLRSCPLPVKPSKPEAMDKTKEKDEDQKLKTESKKDLPTPVKNEKSTLENDSDSDDVEMQVLEKQVSSDDDDSVELSASLTDEDVLLSPSALPATEPKRKKRTSSSSSKPSTSSNQTALHPISYSLSSSSASVPHSSTPSFLSNSSISRSKNSPSSALFLPSIYSFKSGLGSSPEKRGRGRPRKPLADVKSVSGKLYRKKLAERLGSPGGVGRGRPVYSPSAQSQPFFPSIFDAGRTPYDDSFDDDPMVNMTSISGVGVPSEQDIGQKMQRWKDRSTFIYARHKFRSSRDENGKPKGKHMCLVCKVGFTALSSLKRHYGTIYHKQQEAAGRNALDLDSDIPGSSNNGRNRFPLPFQRREFDSFPCSSTSSAGSSSASGNRGGGRPNSQTTRTSSFVRRSAVDNIKKYYAAADAARRRKGVDGSGGSWIQKQQRKRKPLLHSDYIYQSSLSSMGDDEEEDELGLVRDDDAENYFPEDDTEDLMSKDESGDDEQQHWLSSAWKGTGPSHFTCEVCYMSFTKKKEFTHHLYVHRQEGERQKNLTCSDCNFIFPNDTTLEQHFNYFNHGTATGEINGKIVKRFKCSICKSAFAMLEYYKKHLELHKRLPIMCPHCPKKFSYKFYLQDHIKTMHNINIKPSASTNMNGILHPAANGPIGVPVPDPAPSTITFSATEPNVSTVGDTPSSLQLIEVQYPGAQWVSTEHKKKTVQPTPSSTTNKRNIVNKPLKVAALPVLDDSVNSLTISSSLDYSLNLEDGISMPSIFSNSNELSLQNDLELELISSSPSHPNEEPVNPFDDTNSEERLNVQSIEPVTPKQENVSPDSKTVETLGSSLLSDVEQSTIEDGNLVFQFKPETFVSSGLGSPSEAGIMPPMMIEICGDNFEVNQLGSEEHEQKVAVDITKYGGIGSGWNGNESLNKKKSQGKLGCESGKIGVIFSPQTPNSASSTSSYHSLIGCGNKSNIGDRPLESHLICQDCGKSYEHRKSLVKHVRYYRQSEKFYCKICSKSFPLKHHVTRHMKSFHNVETSSTSGTEDFHGDLDFLSSPSGSNSEGLMSPSLGGLEPSSFIAASTTFEGKFTPVLTSCLSPTSQIYPSFGKTSLASSSKTPTSSAPRKIRKRLESSPAVPGLTTSTTGLPSISSVTPYARKKSSSLTSEPGGGSTTSGTGALLSTVVASDGISAFKCLLCKKLYPTKIQLSSHMSYHRRSSQLPYKCKEPDCKKEFKFKSDLTAHTQQEHSKAVTTIEREKHSCAKCSTKNFSNKKDLLKHMREKHHYLGRKVIDSNEYEEEDYNEPESPNSTESKLSRCPLCPMVFPLDSHLNEHMSSAHVPIQSCEKCGQVFETNKEVEEHLKQEHNGQNRDDDDEDNEGDEDEEDDDDDSPPTPSPHPSPLHMPNFLNTHEDEEEEDDDDDDDNDQGDDNESENELLDA